jgi:excisionase family DNA binding protein
MNPFLTARQVENLLNVDRTTVYRMIKDGRLNGVKIGQHWRFSVQEVEELISGMGPAKGQGALPAVKDLPLHCMQPVQEVFAELAQVGVVTTDTNGIPLTKLSNACDFCKLILGSDEGRQACNMSWKKLVEQKSAAPEFTTCHAGLQYARAAIILQNQMVAILVAGQYYISPPDPAEENRRLGNLAEKYQIDHDLLSQAAGKITVLDERTKRQIGGWLERVANTFEQFSSERADLLSRLKQISAMSEI